MRWFGSSITWSAHRPSCRTSSDTALAGIGTSFSITVTSGPPGSTRHAQYRTVPRLGAKPMRTYPPIDPSAANQSR